jgi:hypothetical protein
MGYDYKTELKIPQPLRIECIELFNNCKEFHTPSTLRAFASVAQLELVVKCIPLNEHLDYNELISELLKHGKSRSEPILLDLLDALAREYQREWIGEKFRELKEEIRGAFLQTESEQEKDYQQLVETTTITTLWADRGMEKDYKVSISLKLRNDCVELFKQCDEFKSPDKLRAFASVTELKLVIDLIPASEVLDHNELISKLLKHGESQSEPVLFNLLDALAHQYQQDWKGKRFKEISALIQAENPKQEKDYLQLVEDSAPSDGRGTDESAKRWIEEAGDNLDELALRITLAVFNGTAFEVIERAKNELLEMLQELMPPPPPDPEKPPPVIPHVPLMRRLEKARAKETEGKPPDWRRVIELEKPELAGEATVYVWQLNRETKWRQKLIEWLTNHASGRPVDVRTRAAVAAGRLAVKDYRFVRDKLLNNWVRKNDPQFRTAIGMALGVLVREENMRAEVQGLLREWSESTEGDKRWAAMRAYIYVGAYCQPPGEVIARWRKIAASEHVAIIIPISEHEAVRLNNPLHMSLMDAMVRFFASVAMLPEQERRLIFGGILRELKEWIVANDDGTWLGLFMFTMLGQLMVSADGNGEADGAPVLLQLVEEESDETDYRRQLVGLLELAMRNGATIIEAEELLCAWLSWADELQENSQLYETRIQILFKDMIAADGGGRMRGKLVACLRDCGRNRTAQRILANL